MDIGVATLLGSGLNLTGGLFSNATNKQIARENLAYQREANEKNMRLTKEANDANIQLQRDINNQNIAFQQQENDITRMREDNAVQRAAADMTAAGLSKTLAAGHPASAQGLTAPQAVAPQVQKAQVQALNNQFRYESALQKMNIAGLLQDMAVKDQQLKQSDALNQANIAYIKSQTEGQNLSNSVFMENHGNEQLLKLASVAKNNAETDYYNAKTDIERIVGSYQAQQIETDIAYKVEQTLGAKSNRMLTDKQREYVAVQIAESICRSNKLNREVEMLIKDMVYKDLQIKGLESDYDYAFRHGLPMGKMPGGVFGNGLTTLESLFNMGTGGLRDGSKFDFRNVFGFGKGASFSFPSTGGGSAW